MRKMVLVLCLVAISLGLAALTACGTVAPNKLIFGSCEAARAAVQAAGEEGLYVTNGFDLVFSDRMCFISYASDITAFKEYLKINGQRCHIGYACFKNANGRGGN